jgi:hypothetical protein
MNPIAGPRPELGPTGRPLPRSRAGQTSRARGDALTRIPDAAWDLMWDHAARTRRRDGLITLLAFEVPLRHACTVTADPDGRLRHPHPATQRRLSMLPPDALACVAAWRAAEPAPSADALESWLARTLTRRVRAELRDAGVLWADYLSLSTRRIRKRGREGVWEEHGGRPALVRAITGSPQIIDRRQYLQPTAAGVNRLARAATALAAPLAALREQPAVRDALDHLDQP